MRRLLQFFAALLAPLLVPQMALAQCVGTDLLSKLAVDDPAAHARIFERADAVENGEGKFWRVTRDGAEPSWLFGTFHDTGVSDVLVSGVEGALTGARLMFVELTDAEQTAMQVRITTDPGFILAPDGNRVFDQLTEAELARSAERLAARGLTPELAGRLQPWMLFTSLALPACMIREAQAGKPILDQMLVARAAEAGVPVRGLETYGEALDALISLPVEDVEAMVLDVLRSEHVEEDVWTTTANLYRSGRIAAIWAFSEAEGEKTLGPGSGDIFQRVEDSLLTDRNRAWMAPLLPELAKGGVFTAFGALHLVGETGIVALLRAEGFTVTRLD